MTQGESGKDVNALFDILECAVRVKCALIYLVIMS